MVTFLISSVRYVWYFCEWFSLEYRKSTPTHWQFKEPCVFVRYQSNEHRNIGVFECAAHEDSFSIFYTYSVVYAVYIESSWKCGKWNDWLINVFTQNKPVQHIGLKIIYEEQASTLGSYISKSLQDT